MFMNIMYSNQGGSFSQWWSRLHLSPSHPRKSNAVTRQLHLYRPVVLHCAVGMRACDEKLRVLRHVCELRPFCALDLVASALGLDSSALEAELNGLAAGSGCGLSRAWGAWCDKATNSACGVAWPGAWSLMVMPCTTCSRRRCKVARDIPFS